VHARCCPPHLPYREGHGPWPSWGGGRGGAWCSSARVAACARSLVWAMSSSSAGIRAGTRFDSSPWPMAPRLDGIIRRGKSRIARHSGSTPSWSCCSRSLPVPPCLPNRCRFSASLIYCHVPSRPHDSHGNVFPSRIQLPHHRPAPSMVHLSLLSLELGSTVLGQHDAPRVPC
jgi:hypothetical protein